MSAHTRLIRRIVRDRRLPGHVKEYVGHKIRSKAPLAVKSGVPDHRDPPTGPELVQTCSQLLTRLEYAGIESFFVEGHFDSIEIGLADEAKRAARAVIAEALDEWQIRSGRSSWQLSPKRCLHRNAGIKISLWQSNNLGERERVGTRSDHRFSRPTQYPTRDMAGTIVRCHPGSVGPMPMQHVAFPIDAIITWVDRNDAAWLADYQAASGGGTSLSPDNQVQRFESRDELRYLLRSIDRYAGFFRSIFIVSPCAPPAWLRTETSQGASPAITWIDQQELLRGDPVFNSLAVETALHTIEGLAEHYVYFNDDVFLGRPVRPELFFDANGTSRFFEGALIGAGPIDEAESVFESATKQARDLIAREFGWRPVHNLQHAPYPMTKTAAQAAVDLFAPQVLATRQSQFRSHGNVNSATGLFHYAGYAQRRAQPGPIASAHIRVEDRWAPAAYANLLRRRDVDTFCCNDNPWADTASRTASADRLVEFLNAYFPRPSRYES